jgi:hypothetical protein
MQPGTSMIEWCELRLEVDRMLIGEEKIIDAEIFTVIGQIFKPQRRWYH